MPGNGYEDIFESWEPDGARERRQAATQDLSLELAEAEPLVCEVGLDRTKIFRINSFQEFVGDSVIQDRLGLSHQLIEEGEDDNVGGGELAKNITEEVR